MPVLENQRHERFCQAIADGKADGVAYESAGYKANPGNAHSLKKRKHVQVRITELLEQQGKITQKATTYAIQKSAITKQYVLEAAVENLEKALGRKPVMLGADGEECETWIYRGDVANNTIKMLGAQFGLFADLNVQITGDFEKLSDPELLQLIATSAKTLLVTNQTDSQAEE